MFERVKTWANERFGVTDMWFEVWLFAILIVFGVIFTSFAIMVQQ